MGLRMQTLLPAEDGGSKGKEAPNEGPPSASEGGYVGMPCPREGQSPLERQNNVPRLRGSIDTHQGWKQHGQGPLRAWFATARPDALQRLKRAPIQDVANRDLSS